MSEFTKQAAQAARYLRNEAKRTLARAALVKHPAVKEAFESFPPSMRKLVSLSMSGYANTVYMSFSIRDLDSFKDAKLTRLLEKFLDWTAQVSDCTGGNVPNKDFAFTKMVDGIEISVSIYAYVKSDSPLCRIVVTGVRESIVREEIKELVCA